LLQAWTETGIESAVFFSSFYSSQGRQTSFPDHNSDLIEQLQTEIEDLATLEVSLLGSFYILLFTGGKFCFLPIHSHGTKMETFHLYHLARCWGGWTTPSTTQTTPLTTGPVRPVLSLPSTPISTVPPVLLASPNSVIRAAAAQMVFASRTSQDFITPEEVRELENWTGQVSVFMASRKFRL
jgi:uridine phosphorylase